MSRIPFPVMTDFAGLPARPDRVAMVCGSSYRSPDLHRIRKQVAAILAATGPLPDAIMCLHVGAGPYPNPADRPGGAIEVWLRPADTAQPEMMFELTFASPHGAQDDDLMTPDPASLLAQLQAAGKSFDSGDLWFSVESFDTAWMFLNVLAERLRVSSINLSFGM